MAITPKFTNKDGSQTFYSFACGYSTRKTSEIEWKEMYMEHNTFHVRKGKVGQQFDLWENFASNELTKAKKFYKSLKLA